MSEPTLLVTPAELEGGRVVVRGGAYRHLFRARRLAAGDTLRLVDGEGRAVEARVERVTGRAAELAVLGEAPSNEPAHRLEVWTAMPRPQRASWLVEKATELGAVAVRWIECERGERRGAAAGRARLERVARAAVEQCGRARVPEISGPHAWVDVLEGIGESRTWLLEPGPSRPPLDPGDERSMLIVGPEGGFTPREISELDDLGVGRLGLGKRILRVETAAVAGIALISAWWREARC